MKPARQRILAAISVCALVAGLALMLYPAVSETWNSYTQSRVISSYDTDARELDGDIAAEALQFARTYNGILAHGDAQLDSTADTGAEGSEGNSGQDEAALLETALDKLDITGKGVIGYVSIEKIDVSLPIYRPDAGTSALNTACKLLEKTSLPVGGASTHAVIYAHRGLPSARLFTDLDDLEEGDVFTITVLDETIAYEIDQIIVVDPSNTSAINIETGGDYCTLLTCTPYGINTQRLLVRGARCELEEADSAPQPQNRSHIALLVAGTGIAMACTGLAIRYLRLQASYRKVHSHACPDRLQSRTAAHRRNRSVPRPRPQYRRRVRRCLRRGRNRP